MSDKPKNERFYILENEIHPHHLSFIKNYVEQRGLQIFTLSYEVEAKVLTTNSIAVSEHKPKVPRKKKTVNVIESEIVVANDSPLKETKTIIVYELDYQLHTNNEYRSSIKDFLHKDFGIYKTSIPLWDNKGQLFTKNITVLNNSVTNNSRNSYERFRFHAVKQLIAHTIRQLGYVGYFCGVFCSQDIITNPVQLVVNYKKVNEFDHNITKNENTIKKNTKYEQLKPIIIMLFFDFASDVDKAQIKKHNGLQFIQNKKFFFVSLKDHFKKCDPADVYNKVKKDTLTLSNQIYDKIYEYLNNQKIDATQFKTAYMQQFTKSVDKKISESETIIINLKRKLLLETAKYGESVKMRQALLKGMNNISDSLINHIKTIPEINHCSFTSQGLNLQTHEVFIDHEDYPVYCGIFEINLLIINERALTVRNLASPSKTYHTPHNQCLGSFNESIMSCLEEVDYYTLIETLLKMLKSINTNDSVSFETFNIEFLPHKSKPKQTYEIENAIEIFKSDKYELSNLTNFNEYPNEKTVSFESSDANDDNANDDDDDDSFDDED